MMNPKERHINEESLACTGFNYTLSLISGKYKMTILYTLMEFGVVRFNEMKKYIGTITYKTLSSALKEPHCGKHSFIFSALCAFDDIFLQN